MKFEKKSEGVYMLDVIGYVCPHPQIYTKKALAKLKSGDILQVMFDNPSSGESIASMCENDDNDITDKKQEEGKFIWDITKA